MSRYHAARECFAIMNLLNHHSFNSKYLFYTKGYEELSKIADFLFSSARKRLKIGVVKALNVLNYNYLCK
jgi:hypothetical protein